MNMKEYIETFALQDCTCGKNHKIKIPTIIVEKQAIEKLPQFIAEFQSKKPFLLADKNTFSVAGEQVCDSLNNAGIKYAKYVFSTGEIEPDEKSVGSAIMHFDNSCDLVIAIGSGVINDIGKILANTAKLPYFIVGTAPSMDGYASATSSMSMDGLKVSLPSKCADVIIGDIDVLKNAPMRMLQAGLGDMLAKYFDNVWMAGKNVSADRYAHGAVRVMPPAMSMGQAAGIAATIACKNGLKAKDVPYSELRKELLNQKVYLGK